MNRRSLFRALGAAMLAAPAVAAVARSTPPQAQPLLEAVPVSTPHGPWVAGHSHAVTDPGHSHSYGSWQLDSIHNHHIHYGVTAGVTGAPR